MSPQEIKALIEQGIEGATAHVEGEGNKFKASVVSARFAGLSPVKRQQMVYVTINEQIASGAIHAITLETLLPDEWEKKRRLGF